MISFLSLEPNKRFVSIISLNVEKKTCSYYEVKGKTKQAIKLRYLQTILPSRKCIN